MRHCEIDDDDDRCDGESAAETDEIRIRKQLPASAGIERQLNGAEETEKERDERRERGREEKRRRSSPPTHLSTLLHLLPSLDVSLCSIDSIPKEVCEPIVRDTISTG